MSPMDSIKYVLNILHCGFIAIDPKTGNVKAWIGGDDFRYFQLITFWLQDKLVLHLSQLSMLRPYKTAFRRINIIQISKSAIPNIKIGLLETLMMNTEDIIPWKGLFVSL